MNDFLLTESELRARRGVKWAKYPPDVLPAWVADLDFKVAPAVQSAIQRLVDRQDYVYGLPEDHDALHEAYAGWIERRFGWRPDPTLTVPAADVVQGLVATVVAFSSPGDGVIAQTPVYPPFLRVVESTSRSLVENPLVLDGRYTIDLDGLHDVAASARVLLLCNPHNPTGRVFEKSELERIAAIAEQRDLVVVADEIHADITFGAATHIPMESIAPERTVTLTSATKSFNIPGARAALIHFGSAELKQRFDAAIPDFLLGRPSRFGADATVAAWTDSDGWLADVMRLLTRNREQVARWAASNPRIGHVTPEATYLAWFDCSQLHLPNSPYEFFLDSAKVALSDGRDFGGPGEGHVRLNFGTSSEILTEMLARMTHALEQL